MISYNDESYEKNFIKDIKLAQQNNSLVCFVGAGVSISQGYPGWGQYVDQLINFWIYHLKDIVSLEETVATEFKIEDMNILRELLSSSISIKRRVDMVNYIVKQYCQADTAEKTEKIYKQQVLKFEKFIFNEAYPIVAHNETLDKLVKLQGTFITTNYDNQIEQSYHRVLGIRPQVFDSIDKIEGNVKQDLIIHLHGTPDSNPDLFVSSSKSYMNVYYKDNDFKKKILELFKEKESPLILFVGCSMEEDEILTLLDIEETKVKFYALMKYTKYGMSEKGKNDFIRDYYKDEHKVGIIWYGDQYDHLSTFIEEISNHLRESSKEMEHPNKLRGILLGE